MSLRNCCLKPVHQTDGRRDSKKDQRNKISPQSEPSTSAPPTQNHPMLVGGGSPNQKRKLKEEFIALAVSQVPQVVISDYHESLDGYIKTAYKESKDFTQNGITDFKRAPVVMVVQSKDSLYIYKQNHRVRVVINYRAPIASNCFEGLRAQANAIWHQHKDNRRPGIPYRKFSMTDPKGTGHIEQNWSVQALFKSRSNPKNLLVLFLGWLPESVEESNPDQAPVLRQRMKIRTKFVRLMKNAETNLDMLKWYNREIYLDDAVRNDNQHLFWVYQDLTYYHSELHADYGMGPVFYMCPMEVMVQPPNFTYSMVNVVREDYWIHLLKRSANHTFAQPSSISKPKGACLESRCVCDARAFMKYGATTDGATKDGVILLQHDHNGLLDVSKYQFGQKYVIVECSSVCGCDETCARRQLQQGKVPPVVVMWHEKFGFCLYAAEDILPGQFIIELIGELFLLKEKLHITDPSQGPTPAKKSKSEPEEVGFRLSKDDRVYQETLDLHTKQGKTTAYEPAKRNPNYGADFAVLDDRATLSTEKIGNAGRFIAHSCTPNTALIETHSRRFESDPLIPRLAFYALRKISAGSMFTIQYWDLAEMATKSDTPCVCRPGCPNYIQ